jgi:hypothetical protein
MKLMYHMVIMVQATVFPHQGTYQSVTRNNVVSVSTMPRGSPLLKRYSETFYLQLNVKGRHFIAFILSQLNNCFSQLKVFLTKNAEQVIYCLTLIITSLLEYILMWRQTN